MILRTVATIRSKVVSVKFMTSGPSHLVPQDPAMFTQQRAPILSASARDARDLLRAASAGESLTFFAEGTVISEPGLNRFRAGAFVAAIKASMPIVPLSISGSRHVLAAHTLLPRHGHLRIDILNPVEPSHKAFASSKDLAELARQRILKVLDEPDLLVEKKTRKVPR